MPKQISPIVKLKGAIDDISFYKTQDGFMARQKTAISADRIKTDPKFDLLRRAGQEFGTGGKAGKLFRDIWNTELNKARDNRVTSRVTQAMVAVLQSDPTSDLGLRRVENGDLTLLQGFEFNIGVPFAACVKTQFPHTIDRVSGQVRVNLVSHIPRLEIAPPDNATHYSIFAAAAAIDFATGEYSITRQSSASLPWDNDPTVASVLQMAVLPATTLPIFLLLGVEFVKLVNGKSYPLSKGLSSLQVWAVDQLP
ncbi:hypothetical protein D3H65_20310 [Paraflavitalea soli]|uniref:Uncharacterized protein n=1 Tax=Paraflavitalea soli TaxID=2315862 RepID=A0A3B7MQW6_9BACT|nr:hypothetical protein [Paraflavitalea soli]AXY76187.1 hypothetical protein D3H65_20310 [Paraflavitalea soli]